MAMRNHISYLIISGDTEYHLSAIISSVRLKVTSLSSPFIVSVEEWGGVIQPFERSLLRWCQYLLRLGGRGEGTESPFEPSGRKVGVGDCGVG